MTSRPADGGDLEALPADTCWDLLPHAGVGRLAWTDPDGRILVVPVNFGMDGRAVVVRTGDTVLLDAARAGQRCAFQADDLEPGLRSGWTVLVDGRLRVLTDPAAAERSGRRVSPWLRGPRPHVLLVEATQVSGRRLHAVGGVEVVAFDAEEQP